MMISLAFCAGLALGVVLGCCLWSGAQYVARAILTAEQRKAMANFRQQVLSDHARITKAKEAVRAKFGHEMTQEQERILEQEMATVFKEHPNPQVRG